MPFGQFSIFLVEKFLNKGYGIRSIKILWFEIIFVSDSLYIQNKMIIAIPKNVPVKIILNLFISSIFIIVGPKKVVLILGWFSLIWILYSWLPKTSSFNWVREIFTTSFFLPIKDNSLKIVPLFDESLFLIN